VIVEIDQNDAHPASKAKLEGRLSLRHICFTLICVAASGLIRVAALAGPEITNQNTPPSSDWLSGNGITATWGGLRAKLLDQGVEFFGGYSAEVWGVTTVTGLKEQESIPKFRPCKDSIAATSSGASSVGERHPPRDDDLMSRVASELRPEDIQAVSTYFEQLPHSLNQSVQ
jgi:hypothetical protein